MDSCDLSTTFSVIALMGTGVAIGGGGGRGLNTQMSSYQYRHPYYEDYEDSLTTALSLQWKYPCLERWSLYWHDNVIKWKRFPRYWPSVRGIHRWLVNSPHKGQWRGALMFSLICAWINGWSRNRDAGNLRHHRVHYHVTVMKRGPCGEHNSQDVVQDEII